MWSIVDVELFTSANTACRHCHAMHGALASKRTSMVPSCADVRAVVVMMLS